MIQDLRQHRPAGMILEESTAKRCVKQFDYDRAVFLCFVK